MRQKQVADCTLGFCLFFVFFGEHRRGFRCHASRLLAAQVFLRFWENFELYIAQADACQIRERIVFDKDRGQGGVRRHDGNAEPPLVIDCDGIRALVGRHSYYLYDQGRMTDTFARWAFLAAEDDPMVTLAECAREECRTYPRPLSQDTLANDPFRMDASVVERAFSQMKGLEDFSDIGRVENSIGEAYYYSSELMTEEMAKSLAEFYGVERPASV